MGSEMCIRDRRYGARIVDVSNKRYTPPDNLLFSELPRSIMDGFETARNRNPLHRDWADIQLPIPVRVSNVGLDCTPFLYNTPNYVEITGQSVRKESIVVLPKTHMKPYSANTFETAVSETPPIEKIRLVMIPDGGISRITSKITLTEHLITAAAEKYQSLSNT